MGSGDGVLLHLEEAAVSKLWVRRDLTRRCYLGRRYADVEKQLGGFFGRAPTGPRCELTVDVVVRTVPAGGVRQLVAARPRGVTQQRPERPPLVVTRDGDGDPPVLAGTGVDPLGGGLRTPIAVATEQRPSGAELDHLLCGGVEHRLDHGGFDQRAPAAVDRAPSARAWWRSPHASRPGGRRLPAPTPGARRRIRSTRTCRSGTPWSGRILSDPATAHRDRRPASAP